MSGLNDGPDEPYLPDPPEVQQRLNELRLARAQAEVSSRGYIIF